MGRAIRLLCTGDLHVGRRPSRVSAHFDAGSASCAAMFGQIVEAAVRERVDAVAISGDLVDKENKYHEAYGPVERGLKKLAHEGIDVFAVAGNHDFDVLPRLATAIGAEHFHLLGRGGSWERKSFIRDGAHLFDVVGWSFPAEHVPDNPMRTFAAFAPAEHSSPVPTLGLLHADLDQLDSRYAPVALRDLQSATSVSAWLLGHIHRPRWIAPDAGPGVLYPGSPQAMDPGETGAHGPWLIEIDPSGKVVPRHLPLSLVRYDTLEIDITGVDSKEAFDIEVPRRLKLLLSDSCRDCGPLKFCSVRIRLTGATPLHARLKEYGGEICRQLELGVAGFTVRVEQIIVDTRPPIDLQNLAGGSSIAADLARLILQLAGDSTTALAAATDPAPVAAADATIDARAMLGDALELSDLICSARAYQPLQSSDFPAPDRDAVRSSLLRQGMLLLQTLCAQKGDPSHAGEMP